MGSRKRKQSGPANPLGRAKLSGESDRQPESASAARDAAWVYLVSIDRAAAKVLLGFPEKDQLRIRDRIDALAANPRPVDCKKLQGEDGLYRIRSGDYRVVYAIRDKQLLVLVVRIGDRKDVYRD